MNKPNHSSSPYHYIISFGILIFFGLYIYASLLYPGGSQADANSIGFDWVHNYWCDLLSSESINGTVNPARPVALLATLFLVIALSYLAYLFPKYFPTSPLWNRLTTRSGIGAAFLVIWLFTPLHDYLIIVASLLGLVTVIGIFKGLIHHQLTNHIYIAIFCFLLIILNNVLYYGAFYTGLPLLQKITFALVLLWLTVLSWRLNPSKASNLEN